MKSILWIVLALIVIFQPCFSYIEKRTFRERSKIFCRLKKQCQQYEEWDDNYRKLMKISDIDGAQPDGYLVRFPFYVLAERDAHIVFTETENPDWFVDNVYEIVFGGWENKRTTLRRKRQEEELIFSYTDDILSRDCPLKMLIEITTAGDIRIYVEHSLKPIVEFKDSIPLQIKYFGFSSLGQSQARYFYNCSGELYNESDLKTHCEHIETSDSEFTRFSKIQNNLIDGDNDNSHQYALELPLFVTAPHDAHILLSSDNSFNAIRKGYEIVLGDNMNRRVSVSKIESSNMKTIADFRRADIFLKNETLNVFLRLSKFGKLEIFTRHDHTQYKLLASIEDASYSPLPSLNYLSFAAFNNTPMKFFHDCSIPPLNIDTQLATKYATIGHPLLLEDPAFTTPIDKRNWLTSRCKRYSNFKYEYKDFFKISDIQGSQPAGYQVRLSFYAQGTRNAHVLLSHSATPNVAVDSVYEFIIGGWVNSRVLIRRKKSDPNQVLQQVFVTPILNAQVPTKFIIEVANSGYVRIFAESDQLEPIAEVFDPVVIPVKYVSFCAYDNLVQFYYDCNNKRERVTH